MKEVFKVKKNLFQVISLMILLSFFIVFMTVSCKTVPVETKETETSISETTSADTTSTEVAASESTSETGLTKTTTNTTSTPALEDYKAECIRTDYYKGLDSILEGFKLDSYKCVYLSEGTVVWVVKSQAPEEYIAEGKKSEEAIRKLEKYLNTSIRDNFNGEEKVHFFYGSTGAAFTPLAHYTKPVIFMPTSSDYYSFHAYMHELTHVLTLRSQDAYYYGWAVEGLAVYLNDKLGGGASYPNFGEDIDQMASKYLNNTDTLEKIGDEKYYQYTIDDGFYSLSGSFIKYMVEKIGIEPFMKIYHDADMQKAMKEVTKKNIQEWKSEWISYLSSLPEEG
jgi:hypothetical protein